ncbi:M23 family metallopeptidase [Desulfuribacillus alkaliarsenatis]|uniref:M23ase beta-sheet core domain-containing protein n=1 Tax=Desulfuribacillus alkaliarsenatis TaxID=766136 RepID=A0A1E5G592_9FIRM|nr:M23 family metallopeptidase [Desulfuribacillus alkaliarsenatis]OEF98352.1 hypothetical protein BHF68_01340 [Desulfuribacillus alkaliarsenatis]
MRIKLEGVKRRREQLIDKLKFGDDYEESFDRQADKQMNRLPIPKQVNNNKWIWQSAIAVMLVVSTLSLQQLSAPWAQSSVTFINDVVERDYNWEGVLEALNLENDFFNFDEGIATPTPTSTDPGLYNDFNQYPTNPDAIPVFGQNPGQPAQQNGGASIDNKLGLPIEGLLVKRFTEDKPFLEFIALNNKQVQSVASGKVTQIGYNDKEELLIYVEGEQDLTFVYGRVKDIVVKEGDTVGKGQHIATVDSTDDVELLLFQIIKDGKAVDPEAYLP